MVQFLELMEPILGLVVLALDSLLVHVKRDQCNYANSNLDTKIFQGPFHTNVLFISIQNRA